MSFKRAHWIDKLDGSSHHFDFNPDQITRLTHDGRDQGQTMAVQIVKSAFASRPDWATFPNGEGPEIEIVLPVEYCGVYHVILSRGDFKNWRGEIKKDAFGAEAYHIEPASWNRANNTRAAMENLVPSDEVEKGYEFLSNRYGHDIQHFGNEELKQKLMSLYDDAIIHDRGWVVRSKIDGSIGFLADVSADISVSPEDRREFFRSTGCTLCHVSQWQGQQADFNVAFIPAFRIDDIRMILDHLGQLERKDTTENLFKR